MDFFKSQFDRISQQLGALTPSQKMLTGTLVAVMVMTLMWWGRYAGTAEMEPVLNQSLSDDDVARITAQLVDKHIEYKVVGDKILVPSERKFEALAVLGYNNVMPRSTVSGFDEIIKQISPWDGTDRQNAMFNHGKELTLSRIIGAFPDVANANVVIDPREKRQIGGDIEPTATVTVQMKNGGRAGKQLVKAAANVVAGAQSGLQLRNVKVIVDGVLQKVGGDVGEEGVADADSLRETRHNEEVLLQQKVMDHLSNITGVLVSVTVAVNNQTTATKETEANEKKSLHLESRVESESKDQSNPPPAAAEAGAVPNAQISIGSAAGGEGGTSTSSREHAEFTNVPGVKEITTRTPAGEATAMSCSVRIPHSYFVAVARNLSGGQQPDAKEVKETIDRERAKTVKAVMMTIGLKNAADVSVEEYADAMPAAAAAPAVTAASSVSLAVGGHAKEIALGALALMSLFMVSTIVKKGSPAPLPVPAAPVAAGSPTTVLGPGEAVAGEVAEANSLLDGMEMDEETVRTQQMLEQVSTLVEDNPDAAATLVKRWMNRA